MKSLLKNLFYASLEKGMINEFRRRKHRNSLLILTYHSVLPYSEKFADFDYRNCVSTEAFSEQLAFLKRKYEVITLKEAEKRLRNNTLHGYECVITFDDGFKNNHDYALPVLQKHGLTAVFYITTSFIGSREMLWTEKINAIVMNAPVQEIELNMEQPIHIPLRTVGDREKASVKLRTWLKYQPRFQQENVARTLMEATGYIPDGVAKDADRYAFMTWDEVRSMRDAGMEIGSHTAHHYLLNMLSEEESHTELRESREIIEKELSESCTLFSYPNGAEGNFYPLHFKQLNDLGYTSAVTQIPGFNKPGDNLYALNRVNISAGMTLNVFKAYCAGFHQF